MLSRARHRRGLNLSFFLLTTTNSSNNNDNLTPYLFAYIAVAAGFSCFSLQDGHHQLLDQQMFDSSSGDCRSPLNRGIDPETSLHFNYFRNNQMQHPHKHVQIIIRQISITNCNDCFSVMDGPERFHKVLWKWE